MLDAIPPLAQILINAVPYLVEVASNVYDKVYADNGASSSPDDTAVSSPAAYGPIAPLPADWARYHGARPEVTGAPVNTILNFKGLSTNSAEFRMGLLGVCSRLGIPVDSMTCILSHESGINPKAHNPLPAAGIFQLTTGANLPGYTTKAEIESLLTMTAVEQLTVLEAYYARTGNKYKGATPGQLLLANFLPVYYGKPEDFVIASIPPELDVGFKPAELVQLKEDRAKSGQGFTKAEGYYIWNPGMDIRRVGEITVGDVYEGAAQVCAGPKGVRMRVDGSTFTPQLIGSDPLSRTPVA